jgi:hypothetical protein
MTTIGFYISSHGFGHLTRSLVIIKKLLEITDILIYIGSAAKQLEFAKSYLSQYNDRVIISELNTEIGLINQRKKLSVNQKTLDLKLHEFIKSWDRVVEATISK